MIRFKLKDLLKQIDSIKKHACTAHGDIDDFEVSVTLEFKDPELDNRLFYGELISVCESLRPGCGCTEGINLLIEIEES